MKKSRPESQEEIKLHKALQGDVEVLETRLLGLHLATLGTGLSKAKVKQRAQSKHTINTKY